MAVTAACDNTEVGAVVGLNAVTVVALLNTVLHITIAAGWQSTATDTGIRVVGVSVITGFIPLDAWGEVSTPNAVAANRCLTARATGIDIKQIAVIAFLTIAGLNKAVAAVRGIASHRATILVNVVTVIASFKTDMDERVAAARRLANANTRVRVVLVAIVASLVALCALIQPDTQVTVAATTTLTGRRAGVGIVQVGVIAGFAAPPLNKAVTAAR